MSLGFWVAAAVGLLGVLIMVHEMGHYVVARLFGVKVLRISLGFGPKIFEFTAGATEYRLSIIPLGGYVRLLGEDPSEPVAEIDIEHTLFSKPLWQRYMIVVAGPAFNLILPVFIYLFHFLGHSTVLPPTIGTVLPGLPADESGFRPGDHVETVDGEPISSWEELETIIAENPDRPLRLQILRGTHREERDLRPNRLDRRGFFTFNETVGWVGISPRFHLPEAGILDPTSAAAQAGLKTFDLVTSVNGQPVTYWDELERAIRRAGASPLRLTYVRGAQSVYPFAHVSLQQPGTVVLVPRPIFDEAGSRHYETGLLSSERFVFSVEPGSPADRIGIRHGDRLIALDGKPILHWAELQQTLASAADRTFHITWVSPGGVQHEADFKQDVSGPVDALAQGDDRLLFGAESRHAWRTAPAVPIRYRFIYAFEHAIARTGSLIGAMTRGFIDLVRARVPLQSFGGPITIGYLAGVAAEQGLDQYLWLLALLSINIGMLNFLPVPILDGGLLVFFSIELLVGRPPSRRVRTIASYVGLAAVVLFMGLALKNDVVRFLIK